jgi:hypothetical protein
MNVGTSILRASNLCPNFNLITHSGISLSKALKLLLEEYFMTMWKTILAGTTAIAIAGSTLAYAHQSAGHRDRAEHWRPSAQDLAAFSDARIAAVHAGLKLNADQEKNWPPVEAALRDVSKMRSERFAARASADKPKDPIERLNARAGAMTERGTALKKLADAAGPLYKSLDDAQKHRFVVLARLGNRDGGWRGHHGRHHGGPGMNRHHGPRGERGPASPDADKQPQ